MLNIDNVFHMQEEEKGKKKGSFEEQQIIENLWKLRYPTTLSRNKKGEEKEGMDRKEWQILTVEEQWSEKKNSFILGDAILWYIKTIKIKVNDQWGNSWVKIDL